MLINQYQILKLKGGEIMNKGELMHYGVLGMKWGVRRRQSTIKKSSNKTDSDPKESKVKKKKSVSELSDTELRQAINRIQMEKQLAQLTAKEKSAGAKFVTDVLTNAAKQTATSYTAKYMAKGMDALIAQAAKQAANSR